MSSFVSSSGSRGVGDSGAVTDLSAEKNASMADSNEREELLERGWAALPKEYAIPAQAPALDEARAYCKRLATSHYENFSVATWFLPKHLHQHFFNVYAYCRISDDLGDESRRYGSCAGAARALAGGAGRDVREAGGREKHAADASGVCGAGRYGEGVRHSEA